MGKYTEAWRKVHNFYSQFQFTDLAVLRDELEKIKDAEQFMESSGSEIEAKRVDISQLTKSYNEVSQTIVDAKRNLESIRAQVSLAKRTLLDLNVDCAKEFDNLKAAKDNHKKFEAESSKETDKLIQERQKVISDLDSKVAAKRRELGAIQVKIDRASIELAAPV